MSMSEDVKQFMETSLLEEYVLGVLDKQDIPTVERYIQISPEVRSCYEEMQAGMERLAKQTSIPVPPSMKGNILKSIDNDINSTTVPQTSGSMNWWGMAASFIAIGLAAWLFMIHNEKNDLNNQLEDSKNAYATLKKECDTQNQNYVLQEQQWNTLTDAQTQKFVMVGNAKAPELQVVAYQNIQKSESYLQLLSYPDLPKGKCLKIWADVDGKMIPLDVVPTQPGSIVALPYKKNSTSLNITIESSPTVDHPDVSQLVANVII